MARTLADRKAASRTSEPNAAEPTLVDRILACALSPSEAYAELKRRANDFNVRTDEKSDLGRKVRALFTHALWEAEQILKKTRGGGEEESGDTVAKVLKRLLIRLEIMYRSEGVGVEGEDEGGEQEVVGMRGGEIAADDDVDDDGVGDLNEVDDDVRDCEEEEQLAYERKMRNKPPTKSTVRSQMSTQKRQRRSRKKPISDEMIAREDDMDPPARPQLILVFKAEPRQLSILLTSNRGDKLRTMLFHNALPSLSNIKASVHRFDTEEEKKKKKRNHITTAANNNDNNPSKLDNEEPDGNTDNPSKASNSEPDGDADNEDNTANSDASGTWETASSNRSHSTNKEEGGDVDLSDLDTTLLPPPSSQTFSAFPTFKDVRFAEAWSKGNSIALENVIEDQIKNARLSLDEIIQVLEDDAPTFRPDIYDDRNIILQGNVFVFDSLRVAHKERPGLATRELCRLLKAHCEREMRRVEVGLGLGLGVVEYEDDE